jgi:hypothetical protein
MNQNTVNFLSMKASDDGIYQLSVAFAPSNLLVLLKA